MELSVLWVIGAMPDSEGGIAGIVEIAVEGIEECLS
jgi:hypothetical protein